MKTSSWVWLLVFVLYCLLTYSSYMLVDAWLHDERLFLVYVLLQWLVVTAVLLSARVEAREK